ncbi:MAG: tetratricopeptide repeat protein [Thainema sp.]
MVLTHQARWGFRALLSGCLLVVGCGQEAPLAFQTHEISTESVTVLQYPDFLIDETTASIYRQRGLDYREQGNFEDAIATLKQAVAIDPFNSYGYVVLGWTQHLAGQGEQATNTLKTALQYDETNIEALNALGIVYLVQDALNDAVATHTQALKFNEYNEIAHYNLSLAYERLKDYDAAIQHAQRATELEAYNPHTWVALALAEAGGGDMEAAQAAYDRAMFRDNRYRDKSYLSHLIKAGLSKPQIKVLDKVRQDALNQQQ